MTLVDLPQTTTLAVADPLAAVARLAGSGLFGDYVVYERPGEWVFAADPVGSVELTSTATADYCLTVSCGDQAIRLLRSGRAVQALAHGLRELRSGTGAVAADSYGWIGFEFCAGALDAQRYVAPGTTLAHLMIPRVEVRINRTRATVSGLTGDETAAVRRLLSGAEQPPTPTEDVDLSADGDHYRDRVAAAVREIQAGRYRKVILSRRVELPFPVDIPASYRVGRAKNTPARSFLLRLGGLQAAGFSPELVVAVDEHGIVSTEPLAGTRALGVGDHADRLARLELESDPKEIVEHAVSVRTSFQEIAAVCESGSPAVSDFMSVRERGSVQHLASTVRGHLAAGRTPWDALEMLFPSVTASGIPKRPSVDAIFRQESSPRGLYSGAVITIGPTDALEATLVLRAVYQSEGQAWLRAGAGIIAQSTPTREFTETCEKLASIAPYLIREH